MTTRRCSAPAADTRGGVGKINDYTNVTAGVQKASTARRRLGTGPDALSGAVSTT